MVASLWTESRLTGNHCCRTPTPKRHLLEVRLNELKPEPTVARGERVADVPDRAGAGASGREAGGRRRADAGGAVHHRPAERAEQIPFVAAYFVAECDGRGARAGGGSGRRRGHHDPRFAGWGPDGGRLDAGVYRGDGRGNGRDLGVGGGGHGDPDWGVKKRTQLVICLQ